MKALIGLFAVAALTLAVGCSSRNYAQEDHQACESVGVYWGTPEYVQCRGILYQERQANARQRRANNIMLYNGIFASQQRQQSNCYTTGQTVRCW